MKKHSKKATFIVAFLLMTGNIFPLNAEQAKLSNSSEIDSMITREKAVAFSSSTYIEMRDGIRIAVDIHLPKNYKKGQKIPTLLYQTIYLRSHRTPLHDTPQLSAPPDWKDSPKLDHKPSSPIEFQALANGYAVIKTDVRGTGASFGTRSSPLPPEEIQDNYDILDWIVTQDWSNGNVGTYGISYTGMTSGMAPVVKHPALKASLLGWSGIYDEYKTAMQPYGLVQPGVVCIWSKLLVDLWSNNWQSTGKSPMPVDSDKDGRLLAAAIKEHEKNETVCDFASDIVYSDDRRGSKKLNVQSFSQLPYKKEIEESGVAFLSLASWYDTGASEAQFVRMRHFSNNQKIFLTGGQHGARYYASPYRVDDKPLPPVPSGEVTWGKALQFFDYYLKGIENGYDKLPAITYWNLGEEAFKTSGPWPLPETETLRFYMGEKGTLTKDAPLKETSSDVYKVDYSTTTGLNSRWWTGIGLPMLNLADRREADKKMLTYTSEPLDYDMQITGWPVISLEVASTHEDGAFIAYLEDVDPTGKSTYVNEGGLRALHRKISQNPVNGIPVPYHSFKQQDSAPLTPGKITNVSFEMIPTSVLIKKGHRIRIAIAGADKDNFQRIPSEGNPVITLHHSRTNISFVDLPILPNPQ